MKICFSKAVVEVLFYHKHGLASWRVYPLKLTTKHFLHSKHILVVISHAFIIIRSQDVGYRWSVKSEKNA